MTFIWFICRTVATYDSAIKGSMSGFCSFVQLGKGLMIESATAMESLWQIKCRAKWDFMLVKGKV